MNRRWFPPVAPRTKAARTNSATRAFAGTGRRYGPGPPVRGCIINPHGRGNAAAPEPMQRPKFQQRTAVTAFLLLTLALLPAAYRAMAADNPLSHFTSVIFGCHSETLADFESFARRAKQSGATHIVLTGEDLPWASWQLDTPGDPYPAWAMSNIGLLKIATPDALKPYLPQDYAENVLAILRSRCAVLRKLGLKAAFTTFEPQMLPEQVYRDHPLWRGPQVDHPLRSRVPRFAPSIDNPDVLALYREAARKLVNTCPEIEIVSLHTNDSGSGVSWSDGVYEGPNGNTLYRDRPMYERYRDFFGALQSGARDAGGARLEIDAEWVREASPELIANRLGRGMAVANLEGPNATPYKAETGFLLDYFYPFYPAQGIPLAVRYLEELEQASHSQAPRLFYLIGDRWNQDLYFQIYDAFVKEPTHDDLSRSRLLRAVAAEQAGEQNASKLVDVWRALDDIQRDTDVLNFGGTIFYLGSVQQRWLTRPFVPFPEELTAEETAYYRKYQFQARGEDRALSLSDLQGTRQYEGIGGAAVSGKLFARTLAWLEKASAGVRSIETTAAPETRQRYQVLGERLRVFQALVDNCRDAVQYQYDLDTIKGLKLARPVEIQQQLTDIPEWRDIRDVARREVDNSAVLMDLLRSEKAMLIDVANTSGGENIRVLGPDLADQLQRKIRIMMAHWEDYKRLFVAGENGAGGKKK